MPRLVKSPIVLAHIGRFVDGLRWKEIHDFLLDLDPPEEDSQRTYLPADFGRDDHTSAIPQGRSRHDLRGQNTTLLSGNHEKWGILDIFCDYDWKTRRYKLARQIRPPYTKRKTVKCKCCKGWRENDLNGKWMPPRLDGQSADFNVPKGLDRKPGYIEQLRRNLHRVR
jgi:hypothetical protein